MRFGYYCPTKLSFVYFERIIIIIIIIFSISLVWLICWKRREEKRREEGFLGFERERDDTI